MGNSTSSSSESGTSSSSGRHSLPHSLPFRRSGSLGLSKNELERRCKPSG
eukprot:CAMPEP_0195519058 /NCGR_PEP_ID=MMETSP0794_2-20130614/14304_1 /TAXON_ID=515487 /ORGANISM="Stephanopyxis turris, Strain CCMP 815" /LENGTH=49 /DNA_ID= /DNA_START= /DNA_END= /DNA_ORIENTATION=